MPHMLGGVRRRLASRLLCRKDAERRLNSRFTLRKRNSCQLPITGTVPSLQGPRLSHV
jgi:hypothetical protein